MKTTYTSKALAACTIVMLVGGLAVAALGQGAPPNPQGPPVSAPEAKGQVGSPPPAVAQTPATTNAAPAPQAQQGAANGPPTTQGQQKLLLEPPDGRVKYLMQYVGPFLERITTDPNFAAKAKISPEQVTKLKSIVDKAKRQAMATMEKIMAADAAVGSELTGGHNKAKASALVKKEVELWGELADLFVNLLFDGVTVISVEQFEHAADMAGMMKGSATPNTGTWANQGAPASAPQTTPPPKDAAPTMGANQSPTPDRK